MMMNKDIEEEFVKSAADHGLYSDLSDSIKANEAHDRIMTALSKMKILPDHGKDVLLRLQNNENNFVRRWAATYLLPLDERVALGTLGGIALGEGLSAFNAEMVLKLWRSGKLKLVDWP